MGVGSALTLGNMTFSFASRSGSAYGSRASELSQRAIGEALMRLHPKNPLRTGLEAASNLVVIE